MENQNTIQLDEIKRFADRLFDVLRRAGFESISVPQNLYWTVHSSDAFALGEPPSQTMGDIWDDVSDLRAELVDTYDETVCVWHVCDHLTGLLKALAAADINGELTKKIRRGGRR